MEFRRPWDALYPRVWDEWEEGGQKWVIKDLPPEDDEVALTILKDHMIPDEPLCVWSKVIEDPESVDSIIQFWRNALTQRMSLGCYINIDGQTTMAGLNVCIVDTVGIKPSNIPTEGAAWMNVFNAVKYLQTKFDPFKHFNLQVILQALGLVVKKEFRGKRLGSRILAAREPLCLTYGIKATATMFSGPISQRSAARCGFQTLCTIGSKELADNGMDYPTDNSIVIKYMGRTYDKE